MKSLKKRKKPSRAKRHEAKAPRWQFNIFVYKRATPHYFKVFIHNNRRDLLAWRKDPKGKCEAFYSGHAPTLVAHVSANGDMEYEMDSPCIGKLHFYPGSLSVGIIAHEAFHAAYGWAVREGCAPLHGFKEDSVGRDDNEELCAECCGSLVSQILIELPKLKGLNWPKTRPKEEDYWK